MERPSFDGMRRYPVAAGYYQLHVSDQEKYPCRCEPRCADPCDGRCGCFACRTAQVDRISGDAFKLRPDDDPRATY